MVRAPRRRRGGGPRAGTTVLVAIAVGIVAVTAVGPVASFTVASVDRQSGIGVATDGNATVGLAPAASVPTGETSRILAATNRLNQTLDVRVSLVEGSEGDATLQLDGSSGDTVSTTVTPGETVPMSTTVDCGAGPLTLSVTATNGSFRFHASRTVDTVARCSAETAGRPLVYVNGEGALRTLAGPNAAPTNYSVSPTVIGPATVDFDGDGAADVPYAAGTSTLALTDGDGGRALNGTLDTTTTRFWVGAWQTSGAAVYYASEEKNVARVRPGGQPTTAAAISSTTPNAVAGVGDVVGDSTSELVFVGGSQQIRFTYTNGTTVKTSASASSSDAVGAPTDFDGDGRARVPLVDGSNNLQLVRIADGSVEKTKLAAGVEKTGVAVIDWDGDSAPEILYVDASSNHLRYVDDVTGAATTHRVQSASGNVTVGAAGVA